MHTSLDQALGRNPRLSRVGQSLLNIASGASAAYSLRSLNGGDPNVVRVRRDSDNSERDFTASEVSSGELKNWVNSQTTLPLDLKTLQADGRTGAIIDAKAAYSLRNLSSSYTGNVIEVRRSSDDTERDFTASEVSDGTLTDWVGDYQTELSVARNYTTNPYESFTNASSSGFTASNSSGTGFAGFDLSGSTGDKVEVSFELTIRSGSPQIKLRTAYDSSGSASLGTTYTTSGTKTITLTATNNFGFIAFSEGDIPADFDVSNFQIVSRSSDGFVKTWYDQSSTTGTANNNHATQSDSSKQPKIVENGNLVEEGNNPALSFDGTNDVLLMDSALDLDPFSILAVGPIQGATSPRLVGKQSSSNNGMSITEFVGNSIRLVSQTGNLTFSDGVARTAGDVILASMFFGAGDTLTAFVDGATQSLSGTPDSNTALDIDQIGARQTAGFMSGKLKELIIYDTDQTDNRTALEANIGEHYSISGIPAYDNTVNGFVETWYDQSGSGNDATQTSADAQPKIVGEVTSGQPHEFLGAIDFDGTDDFFSSNHILSQDDLLAVHAVAKFNNNTDRQKLVGDVFFVNTSNSGGFNLENKVFNLTALGATLDDSSVSTYAIGSPSDIDTSNEQLFTMELASGTLKLYADGSELDSVSAQMNSEDGGSVLSVGAGSAGSSPLNGTIKEMVIYNSDQSSKRELLEANIAAANGITLS